MSEHPGLARGFHLYNAQHYQEAAAMFLEVLRDDSQNAEAQAMLALCLVEQKQWRPAVQAARLAVELDPEEPLAHKALALVYLRANRLDEAHAAITTALSLDPDNADYWRLAGVLNTRRFEWKEALEAAERGLQCQPGRPSLLNLRAMALMKLGRLAEARAGLKELLAENPEDPDSLANLGWAALHQSQATEALEYFKTALQLEPENDYARQGLLEGLRSRYPLYGLFLRFFLWMSGMSRDAQNAIQAGLYVGQALLERLAKEYRWMRRWLKPILFLYQIFAFMTWIARPLTNLLLRLNPYGKLVLTADDVAQSNLVGACLGVSALFGGIHLLTGDKLAFLTWIIFMTLTVPVSSVHDCQEGWPRTVMGRVALCETLMAVLGMLLVYLGVERGWYLVGIYANLIVPTQFLAMYLTTVDPEMGHE